MSGKVNLPADDFARGLTVASSFEGKFEQPHIGLAGDTYTILLSGKDTAGRYCLIDMYVPPGGGPPLHRHDYEESFTVLEGEVVMTFRGEAVSVRAGEVVGILANAPHRFKNESQQAARLLCVCSPAGLDEMFMALGVPVATRTTPAPKLSETEQAAFREKAAALAGRYRTEFL